MAPNCIYAYRVRAGSISHSVSQKHVDMQLRILKKLIAEPLEGSEAQQDAYNGYVAFQYCTILINMRLSKPPASRETKQQIHELSWLLRYDANRIVKLISRVYRVLGFTLTSWLLLIYFKLFCKYSWFDIVNFFTDFRKSGCCYICNLFSAFLTDLLA